jgi:hypothetical protein
MLVRASNYLQQFNLNVHHKPGKEHIVPDALSRLKSSSKATTTPELDFDAIDGADAYNFTASLTELSTEFKLRI